jgi:hypothetical protein
MDATDGSRGAAFALVRGVGRALGALPRPVAAAALAGWMALIWWLSSGRISVKPPLPASGFLFNFAHAPFFGMLAALAAAAAAPRPLPRSWPDPGRRARWIAFAIVAGWAVIDELHQGRVGGRHASPFDLVTDVAGAASVLWIAAYAGGARADERGLRLRLAVALALCAAAAFLSTFVDRR